MKKQIIQVFCLKLTLLVCLISIQVGISQNFCSTYMTPLDKGTLDLIYGNQIHEPQPIYFRIHFHVFHKDDGSGGQTYSDVAYIFQNLNDEFNPNAIYFLWDGCINHINDTEYYTNGLPQNNQY